MSINTVQPEIYEIPEDHNAASLKEIAEKLRGKGLGVFKIYLDRIYTKKLLGAFQGIELLKWLRILGVQNHCILISPIDLQSLLRLLPTNEVVLLKGSTFFENGTEIDLTPTDPAQTAELREYFRRHIDVENRKHLTANRFGLERLQHIHERVDSIYVAPTDQGSDIEYEAFKFAYDVKPITHLDESKFTKARKQLHKLRSTVQRYKPLIILVDDKAPQGWGRLFRSILGNNGSFQFHVLTPTDGTTEEKLARDIISKGLNKQTVWKPHLLIMDLRLLSSEETVNRGGTPLDDYQKLLSFRTLRRLGLRDEDNLQLRILFSTASKDGQKLAKLSERRHFGPNGIFYKEGIEQMLTPQQSLENYEQLLTKLNTIIVRKNAKEMLKSELSHPDVEEKRSSLAQRLNQVWNDVGHAGEINEVVRFDDIILDVNTFLREENFGPISDLLKTSGRRIQIPITVAYELEWIASDVEYKYDELDVVARFFLSRIKELGLRIEPSGVSYDQRVVMKSGDAPYNNMADDQIVEIARNAQNKIMVISHDKEDVRKEIANINNPKIEVRKKLPLRAA